MHSLLDRRGRRALVAVEDFFAVTRQLNELHFKEGDCTHFCYSPAVYLVSRELFVATSCFLLSCVPR
jgi:hypothetical protein